MKDEFLIVKKVATEMVEVNNNRWEAIKNSDYESFVKFDNLFDDLKCALKNFGYRVDFEYQGCSTRLYVEGRVFFRMSVVLNIEKREKKKYDCPAI